MTGFLSDIVMLAAVVLLARIVQVDFHTLKIRNRSVLILLGLYVVWGALGGFETLLSDMGAGALLFLTALVMWLAGAMGAGDVKLYAVLGLLIGYAQLGLYVILLITTSVLFVIALRLSGRMPGAGRFVSRLREIQATGKAPYAVPMCLAAIPAMVVRALTQA